MEFPMPANRPNLLFIMPDQLRPDFSAVMALPSSTHHI